MSIFIDSQANKVKFLIKNCNTRCEIKHFTATTKMHLIFQHLYICMYIYSDCAVDSKPKCTHTHSHILYLFIAPQLHLINQQTASQAIKRRWKTQIAQQRNQKN